MTAKAVITSSLYTTKTPLIMS